MWCCFTANTAVEPTKLKPLTAEVPVTTKPVTLMFRLPSEDDVVENVERTEEKVESDVEVQPLENAQGEEVPSLERDDACATPCTIFLAICVIGMLYIIMADADKAEL